MTDPSQLNMLYGDFDRMMNTNTHQTMEMNEDEQSYGYEPTSNNLGAALDISTPIENRPILTDWGDTMETELDFFYRMMEKKTRLKTKLKKLRKRLKNL